MLDQIRRDLKVDAVFYPEEADASRQPIDPITMAVRQGRVSAWNMIQLWMDRGK